MLAVVDGVLKKGEVNHHTQIAMFLLSDFAQGDKIMSAHGEEKYEVAEVGIMHPEQVPTGYL
jgi:hypothetical protein